MKDKTQLEFVGAEKIDPRDPRDLVEGDKFVGKTLRGVDSGQTPDWAQTEGVIVVPNPFPGHSKPTWFKARRATPDTEYKFEVTHINARKNRGVVEPIQSVDAGPTWLETARDEGVAWTGTPQTVRRPTHGDVMSEGDVRGDKNDLIDGRQ